MFDRNFVFRSEDVPSSFSRMQMVTNLPCSKTYGSTIYRKGGQYMVMITVDEMTADAADLYGADSIRKLRITCSSLDDNESRELSVVRSVLRENSLAGKELRPSL